MGAFQAIAYSVLASIIFCIGYISFRTARFPAVQMITGGRRWLAVLLCAALYLVIGYILYRVMNGVNAAIVSIHFGGFWLLCELLFLILRKITHKPAPVWAPGVFAILFTVCYMIAAWYLCSHVWEKDYSLENNRLKGNLRIIQFADSHVGTTFHAQGLHDYVEKINALHPDIVVITGDFVDDSTTREDMIGSCEALGDLETKYGVFFSYGNHDKGYYAEKGWNNDDLLEHLAKNNVTVLQDEALLIDKRFYVIGRQDRFAAMWGGSSRKTPAELTDGLDPDLYKVVLDHQPVEYDEEAKADVDLVLSGHTHGGQFFPFNNTGVLTHEYDRSYGHEKRGTTDFIVTSGISDWALIFKTGCRSEYVVVDVHGMY